MRLVLKYRIRLPRNLLLLFKTFIQTEALGKILDSDASILEVTRPYAENLVKRGYEAKKVLQDVESSLKSAGGYVQRMPKMVHDILKNAAAGQHRIEVRHNGLDPISVKFEKAVNRVIVGVIISASTIAGALILNSSQKVLEFTVPMFGGQTVTITGVLGITAYTIATVLGLWLIVCIIRSGKM